MQKVIFCLLLLLCCASQTTLAALGLLSPVAPITSVVDRCTNNNDLKHFITGHDVKFPCQSTKNIYISSGRYEPKNIIATRMQIGQNDAFVALPRLKSAVPFTLSKISLKKSDCTTLLEPYPCWSIQEEGNCDALQSVIDLVLDAQVK